MQIELNDEFKFGSIWALENAIRTFKLFIEKQCVNIRCSECQFRYGIVEGAHVCPNCELGLSDDIERLEMLLKLIEGSKT